MADITMPQLGETVTEGTITRWAKQVGDHVDEDEILFEVSTDKVDSEVPAPTSGFVTEILVPEGETVDVGAKLAVIEAEAPAGNGAKAEAPPKAEPTEEEPEAKAAPKEEPAPAEAEPAPAAEGVGSSMPKEQKAADTSGDGKVLSPVVRRLIAEH